MDEQISTLEVEIRRKHAERWRPMRNLIEGPILTAEPGLRPYWNRVVPHDRP